MSQTAYENWHGSGRYAIVDDTKGEVIEAMYPFKFIEDFIGADIVIPASGSVESGCKWSKKIVGDGTVASAANAATGAVTCTLVVTSEKQDAALHANDQLNFSIAKSLIAEITATVTVLPTGNGKISFGLHGAWADGGSLYRVGFEVPTTGLVVCESDDNATDTSASSGVTLVAGTSYVFRIVCVDQTDIEFYINGNRVAATTTFANAASASNSKCQPHVGGYKASGTGLGAISIDSFKIWQERA